MTHLFGNVRNYPLKQTYMHSIALHVHWRLLRKFRHYDFRVYSLFAYIAIILFFGSTGILTLGS